MNQKILFLIIFSLFCQKNFSQINTSKEVKNILDFANYQYEKSNFHLAIKEYQRALYWAKDTKNAKVYSKLANCYFSLENYKKAGEFFDLAYYLSENDSFKYSNLFRKIECFLLTKQFNYALMELNNMDSLNYKTLKKKSFYIGVSYFGLRNFKNSEHYFLMSLDSFEHDKKFKIKSIFEQKKLFYPNPRLAKNLSLFIPGSGQMYIKDFKNMINSTILVGSLGYLTVHMIKKYSYLDALLSIFPWFFRYYQGGYQKIYKKAKLELSQNRNEIYKEILGVFNN